VKYFAYGANLDRDHMRRTAPGATPSGTARLPGYRVAIGHAGFGTLVPDPAGVVLGLLWELTPDDERALDRFERVGDGLYHKQLVGVDWGGVPIDAMIYVAADNRPGAAHPDYLRWIAGAAAGCGFPTDYVRSLEDLPRDCRAAALP
jgi:hypothetical protein